MSENLSQIIDDEHSLEVASSILHDAMFSEDGIRFDPGTKTFTLSLWREVPEVKRTTRVFLVFRKTQYLHTACTLTLFNVESANIQVRDTLRWYNLFGLEYHAESHTLRFETEGAIDITLHIGELAGGLVDTGQTTWEQFGYCTVSF